MFAGVGVRKVESMAEIVGVAGTGSRRRHEGNERSVTAWKPRRLIFKPASNVDLRWYAGKRMKEGKEVTAGNENGWPARGRRGKERSGM